MEAMASKTYDGGRKPSRIFARVFALLALAAVSVVLVVVISRSLDSSSTTTVPAKHAQAQSQPRHSAPPDDCYTVQDGDLFSNIAKHEHVIQRTLIQRNGGAKFDSD